MQKPIERLYEAIQRDGKLREQLSNLQAGETCSIEMSALAKFYRDNRADIWELIKEEAKASKKEAGHYVLELLRECVAIGDKIESAEDLEAELGDFAFIATRHALVESK
jgi:hypothetical protein